MTRNIRLKIEYDGTRFCGWQRQRAGKRLNTVQGEIEKAAKKLFGEKISLTGAGRTDAGVHAEAQTANFKVRSELPLRNIEKGLNSYLPKDIAVLSAEEVGSDFHARFNAKGKLYRYTIINRKTRSPLLKRYAAFVSYDLDITKMKMAAKYLVGRRDFTSFQASPAQGPKISCGSGDKRKRGAVRTVKRLDIVSSPPLIEIYIQANGFLYNMVRNIVGTLIDVGRGRIAPEKVNRILARRCRSEAGQTAPAKGLCLLQVFYNAI